MSDGPHRSLPMRPGWKKVAEYADNEAFASDELCDAVVSAVERDWRKDISPGLVACIQDVLGVATLCSKDTVRAVEELRPSVAGCPMGNALLDHLAYVISDGKSGDAALREAVICTLTDWSARCARQVEEHYLRESNAANTKNVRGRIEEAIQKAHFADLAVHLLDPNAKQARQLKKRDGLDDGVQL